ncbi:helix-turn-helix domain-containing protein [Bacillus sp. 71mf]|uniref:helix-turn-helix domain-containing protein n=1 Tax=Bacillus sp. 71mf TaxID=1761757 RepID=UPI000B877E98|nr:helix-turn-helix domain-containing protein [Bacillus sp. 71mf]
MTIIRLIMQGYYVVEIAKLLHIHHKMIARYVKKFSVGNMISYFTTNMHLVNFHTYSPEDEQAL